MKSKFFKGALNITPYVLVLGSFGGFALRTINEDFLVNKRYDDLKKTVSESETEIEIEESEVLLENEEIVVTVPEETIIETIPEEIIEEPIEEPIEEIITYESDLLESGYEFKDIDFESLKEVNEDSCSWLTIDGTNIDYPVVQGEDNDYYLHHDIYGNHSSSGTLFVDSNVKSLESEELSQWTVIYGHKMKNGTMFSDLHKYKDPNFYNDHKYGVIYTPDGYAYKAEIFACNIIDANNPITINTNQSEEDIFNEYIQVLKENSTFESNVNIQYGDDIIEFVTCSYETNNSRCVVAAKLIKEYTNYNQLSNNKVK